MTHRHGFTRIEAPIFIVLVATLGWSVVPGCGGQRVVGPDPQLLRREAELRATLQQLRDAVALFLSDTGAYPCFLSEITKPASEAPERGLHPEDGYVVPINPSDYRGPYITTPCGGLPWDPIHGNRDWVYPGFPPHLGQVFAWGGRASDGTDYSTW